MKITGAFRWIAITVAVVIAIVVVLQIVARTVLPSLINNALRGSVASYSDGLYRLDVDQVKVRLFRKSISLEDVKLTYDTARVNRSVQLRQGKVYSGIVDRIHFDVHGFSYFWSGRYLAIDAIRVNEPTVFVHRFPAVEPSDTSQQQSSPPQFNTYQLIKSRFDSLRVASLLIDSASVNLVSHHDATPQDTISVRGARVAIREARVDSVAASQFHGWPRMQDFTVSWRNPSITSADKLYHYQADSVGIEPLKGSLLVEGLAVEPLLGRYEMGEQRNQVVNWIQLNVASIATEGIDFPRLTDSMALYAQQLTIDSPDFTLFRDLRLPGGPPKKRPMLQEMLQSIPVPLTLDSIAITRGNIRYEEHRKAAQQSGHIIFGDLQASISGISNRSQDSTAVLIADVQTHLMNKGKGNIHFEFPLTSTTGEHRIRGTLGEMSLSIVNPASEPLAFTEIERGTIQKATFEMDLDAQRMTGNVDLRYHDLEVNLLKEATPDQQKVLKTLLANLLVLKKSNPTGSRALRPGPIATTRDSTQSMFSYWWAGLRSGLKASLGVSK